MASIKSILSPFDSSTIQQLQAGEQVEIHGTIYGMRDAAHKRLIESMERNDPAPVDLAGQVIYYVGPAPAKPGHAIGPAGPTTSGRMDPYTIQMLKIGVKGFIGKGYRSPEIKEAMIEHQAVYLAAIGGAAALLAKTIVESKVVAYPDLGPEAIYAFKVQGFPAIVVNDVQGRDAYQRSNH